MVFVESGVPKTAQAAAAAAAAPSVKKAPASDAQIWGGNDDRVCKGRITQRRLFAVGAAAGGVILGLGLFLGLSSSSQEESSEIVGQAVVDANALGCYVDERFNRVFENKYTNEAMTPAICQEHCQGYAYYGLQWGIECWCGVEGVDLDEFADVATPVCNYECGGDAAFICGGYLAFTAYDIDIIAGEAGTVPSPTPTTTTPTTPSPDIDGCTTTATVRFATETAYFEGGGCATLTDMYNAQGTDGPLYTLDANNNVIDGGGGTPTGYWLLTRDLRVVDDVTLYVHGTSIGGDCDVLRIQSDGSSAFYELRGHGGSLSFKSTKVTSWDTEAGAEQTSYSSGRSYINCVSEGTGACAKNDMGECRMDIIDSVMGNMGWMDSESYGLTWKVRGFCSDLSNPEVFDVDQVYGDIEGSEIYGMYYGMYTYGHQGGVWTNNIMRDNIQYGFDPHDDSDDLTIADNKVYGNGNHGIIASKRCNNVKIYNNEVYDGGEGAVGIFLHRSSDDAEVYNNYVHDMQDAGFAIMESMNADIHDNTVENVKYGVRISLGGSDNKIYDNVFDTCSSYGFYTYEGSDEPDVSDGLPTANVFDGNTVSNTETGVKITDGVDNVFTNNIFTGTTELEFADSTGTTWTGNSLPTGTCLKSSSSDFTSTSDAVQSC